MPFLSEHAPVLILGHGLAGCAVAWQLLWRGQAFTVVDEELPITSSKIAAGLLTPITGMRLSLAPEHERELRECLAFYRRVQQRLGVGVVHPRQHLRILRTEQEQQLWPRRRVDPRLQGFLRSDPRPLDAEHFQVEARNGFQMRHGGWVDTAAYLHQSRRLWQQQGSWVEQRLEPAEVEPQADGWTWQGRHYRWVIDCRGWSAGQTRLWNWLPWDCAKGTILTLQADLGQERRIIHHGCWVVPRGDGTLRVGSTYDKDLRQPYAGTAEQVQQLQSKLSATLRCPWQMTAEATAVRPILQGQRVVMGTHPGRERWAVLNGLGSKGALRAPGLADQLLCHLLDGQRLPLALDVRSNF
jgi:glycine oxidase